MPEEGPLHVLALQIMQRWLIGALPADLELAVRAPLHLSDGAIFTPDLAVLPAGFAPADMTAANAHLVIELSDPARNRDPRDKVLQYAAAGIGELWTVDAPKREIAMYRGATSRFWTAIGTHSPGARIAPLCAPKALFSIDDLPKQ